MKPAGLEPISRFRHATSGEPLQAAQVGAFDVLVTQHEPYQVLAEHAHADATLNVVLAGGFAERLGAVTVDNTPGTVVVKPQGAAHTNRFGGCPTQSLLVQLGGGRPRAAFVATLFSALRVSQSPTSSTLAVVVIRHLHHTGDSDVAEAALMDLIFEAASVEDGLARPARAPLAQARNAIASAAENGRPVQLGSIAAGFGMSPSALSQSFRRNYGVTPLAFARERRVQRARALLRGDPDLSLAEAAQAAGFADQAHLTRAFRAHTGVTPGDFRRYVRHTA